MIHGPETLDDAGIISLGNGRALVQSVDFFPPIVDDPGDFGRIAAANALSDLYAMGATPFCALNLVGFPSKKLDMAILGEILEGGAEKMREAGVALLGGHSVEDAEIKYGLAVTGIIDSDRMLTNGGAEPGDLLVLTKPLGMGALSTGIQQGRVSEEDKSTAVGTMATLNAGAARVFQEVSVTAVTDITGFGLLGHSSEMARASGVTLSFNWDALPITPGARSLASRGVLSGGAARSRRYLGSNARIDASVPGEVAEIAFDSETSGGLLIAVSPEKSHLLLKGLQGEDVPCATIIGKVLPQQPDVWVELG